MNDEFTVTTERTHTYRRGWGVHVSPVWDGNDDGNDSVSDIDVSVIEITPDNVTIVGGAPCLPVPNAPRMFVPVESFADVAELAYDDHHDLRARWFATEAQAREHAASVTSTWTNPAPWVSFVALDGEA